MNNYLENPDLYSQGGDPNNKQDNTFQELDPSLIPSNNDPNSTFQELDKSLIPLPSIPEPKPTDKKIHIGPDKTIKQEKPNWFNQLVDYGSAILNTFGPAYLQPSTIADAAKVYTKGLLNVPISTLFSIAESSDVPIGRMGGPIPPGMMKKKLEDIRTGKDVSPQEHLLEGIKMHQEAQKKLDEAIPTKMTGFSADLISGFASTTGFILTGAGLGMVPTMMVGGASESAGYALQTYDNMKSQGMDVQKNLGKLQRSWGVGFLSGTSEALPIEHIIEKVPGIDKLKKNALKTFARYIITSGGEEGLQEFGQQFVEGLNDRQVLDKVRPWLDIIKDSSYNGLIGLLSGSMMSTISAAAEHHNYTQTVEAIKNTIQDKGKAELKSLKGKIETLHKAGVIDDDFYSLWQEGLNSPDALNNIENGIKSAAQKQKMPGSLAGIKNTLDIFQEFGSSENPLLNVNQEDAEDHKAAMEGMKYDFPTALAESQKEIDKAASEGNYVPNLLNHIFTIGKYNFLNYIKGAATSNADYNYVDSFKAENPIMKMDPADIHSYAQTAISEIEAASVKNGLLKKLTNDGIPEELGSKLKTDLATAVTLNFENLGWNVLRSDWTKKLDEYYSMHPNEKVDAQALDRAIEQAKKFQNPQYTSRAKSLLNNAFISIEDQIGEKLVGEALDQMEEEGRHLTPELQKLADIGAASSDILNQRISPNGFNLSKLGWVVAIKDTKANRVYKGESGDFHSKLANRYDIYNDEQGLPLANADHIIEGYIDEAGKFYSKDWMEETFGISESFTLGIAKADVNAINQEFMKKNNEALNQRIQNNSPQLFQKTSTSSNESSGSQYNDFLGDFQGKNFADMYNYMKANNLIGDETEVIAKTLKKYIGDVPVILEDLNPDIAGQYVDGTIYINSNAHIQQDRFDPYRTFAHEAIHALTADFMRSNTVEGQKFVAEINGIMNQVSEVFHNPQRAVDNKIWLGTSTELDAKVLNTSPGLKDALNNEFDFVAAFFSNTDGLRYILNNISYIGTQENITTMDAIKRAFINLWHAILGNKPTLFDAMFTILDNNVKNLEAYHNARRHNLELSQLRELREREEGINNEQGREDITADEALDSLDVDQYDDDPYQDEKYQDLLTSDTFISIASDIAGIKPIDFIAETKNLTSIDGFLKRIAQLNQESNGLIAKKIKNIYDSKFIAIMSDFNKFRSRFLTYIFNQIKRKEPRTYMRISKDYFYDRRAKERSVQTTFVKDASGTSREVGGATVLETFLRPLETLMDIPQNSFKLTFISAFDISNNGILDPNSGFNVKRLNNRSLGLPTSKTPVTDNLAHTLFEYKGETPGQEKQYRYLYLGLFGSRSTLPVLTIPNEHFNKVVQTLHRYKQEYINLLNQSSEEFIGVSEAMQVSNTARLLFEDMWYGAKFIKEKDNQFHVDKSLIADKDLKKILKRGTKFLIEQDHIVEDDSLFKKIIGKKTFSGIEYKNGHITANMAIFSSSDPGFITVTVDGVDHQVPFQDILINAMGTETTDGTTFYLFDEFDEVYGTAFGVFKSGVMKNFYASHYGEGSLFLKHAMFGVHKDSPIGKFMRAHNLALLTSDTAAKIVPDYIDNNKTSHSRVINISDYSDGKVKIPVENILSLPLNGFQRIGENQYTDITAGPGKQWFNGSDFGVFNPIIKAAGGSEIQNVLNRLIDNLSNRTISEIQELSKIDNLLTMVNSMIENPKGITEESISKTLNFLSDIDPELAKELYGNIITLPHVGKALRHRFMKPLKKLLSTRIGGMRLTLRANVGHWNNNADISPIENEYNINGLLTSLPLDHDAFKAAYPEAGLGRLVKEYKHLQTLESLAHTKRDFSLMDDIKNRKQTIKENIFSMGIASKDEDRRKALLQADIYAAINFNSPKVTQWKNEVVYGKTSKDQNGNVVKDPNAILDPLTGRLNKGWVIISKDFANKYGLKPGDQLIAIVTPTDSPLGIMAVKVGGIAPSFGHNKVVDNMTAAFNSEYIQSIVGKDFDIDTIAIVPFDPDYWSPEDFNKMWKTINDASDKYEEAMVSVTKKEIGGDTVITPDGEEIPINKKTVFTNPIREAFCIAMNGESVKGNKEKFNTLGKDFQFMDNAYLQGPAGIISERQYHTMLSAINFEATKVPKVVNETDETGASQLRLTNKETNDYRVNHPKWLSVHKLHNDITNFSVDFPGNTSKLTFISDPNDPQYQAIMFKHMFGVEVSPQEGQAVRGFIRWAFDGTLELASNRDANGRGQLEYTDARIAILRSRAILQAFQNNTTVGKTWLKEHYDEHLDASLEKLKGKVGDTHPYYQDAKEGTVFTKTFIHKFIDGIHIDEMTNYPLFRSLLNLHPENLTVPGTSYEDFLSDQALASKDLLKTTSFLEKLYEENIKGEVNTSKASFFRPHKNLGKREANEAYALLHTAWIIHNRRSIKQNSPQLSEKTKQIIANNRIDNIQKMYHIISNDEDFKILFDNIQSKNQGKFKSIVKEFIALRDIVDANEIYPADFIRDNKPIGVTNIAIALSLIPREIDYETGRYSKDPAFRLSNIREEIIAIMHAFDEPQPTAYRKKSFKDTAEEAGGKTLQANRWGRQTAFPILFKGLLEKPKIKFLPTAKEATLTLSNNSQVTITPTIDNELRFVWGDQHWTHNNLRKEAKADPESRAGKLYSYLTRNKGAWKGQADDEVGTVNRQQLSSLLRFGDNIRIIDRVDILKDYIQRRMYANSPADLTSLDRVGLWMSFLGQTTNVGLRDNKAINLIVNRSRYSDSKPNDFQGNEVLYQLMSYFEPKLFQSFLRFYNDNVKQENRLNNEMGIRVATKTSAHNGDILNQRIQHPADGAKSLRHFFKAYMDEVNEAKKDVTSWRTMDRLARTDFPAAMKHIRKMIRSNKMLMSLAAHGMYGAELVHDIDHLSETEFNKKYSKLRAIDLYENILIQNPKLDEAFMKESFGIERTSRDLNEGTNPGPVVELFWHLKAIQKAAEKGEKKMGKAFKTTVLNFMAYENHAPVKERKVYFANLKDHPIDHYLTYRGNADLTVKTLHSFRSLFPNPDYKAYGESSIAIAKARAITTTLNQFQATMAEKIQEMDDMIGIISSQKARDNYLRNHNMPSDIKMVQYITDATKEHDASINVKDQDPFLLRKDIFELSERMALPRSRGGEAIRILRVGSRILYHDVEQNKTYHDKLDLLQNRYKKASAKSKLTILAGLAIRELYDYHVPNFLIIAKNYMTDASNMLLQHKDYDGALKVMAYISRYTQYLEAIIAKEGNYMPHFFPEQERKLIWMADNKVSIRRAVISQIKWHIDHARRGDFIVNPKLSSIDLNSEEGKALVDKMTIEKMENQFSDYAVANPGSYVIPNMLPRQTKDNQDYIKTNSKVHLFYTNELINGLKNDLLYIDWLTYQSKARAAGENSANIEMTRMWYADQIQNKYLHTATIDKRKVERGMQVTFLTPAFTVEPRKEIPSQVNVPIWGTVDKIDFKEGTIQLYVDKAQVLFKVETDLAYAEKMADNMDISMSARENLASMKQLNSINNLLHRGFLHPEDIYKKLTDLTIYDAAQIIVKGLNNVRNNIDRVGKYKLEDIFTKDFNGQHNHSNIERYMHRGASERLSGKAREIHNLREMDGYYGNAMQPMTYATLKTAAWATSKVVKYLKEVVGLLYLGLTVGPKAFVANKIGAMLSNLSDAPMRNWGIRRDAIKQWSRDYKGAEELLYEERDNAIIQNNTMTALGLQADRDMVNIVLGAANIDSVDMLSGDGFIDKLRYILRGFQDGLGMKKYFTQINKLKEEAIMADNEAERNALIGQVTTLTMQMRKKIEAKAAKKGQRISSNLALAEKITAQDMTKLLARYFHRSFVRGYFGMGLQAIAERERRPAFYIGYLQALENGYSEEDAIQFGINSISYRHAFYDIMHKQYGANTIIGKFTYQFSQYTYNNVTKNYSLIRDALPQLIRAYSSVTNGSRASRFFQRLRLLFSRVLPKRNIFGEKIRSNNQAKRNIGTVNLARVVLMRTMSAWILSQLGARIFYGLGNYTDPLGQLTYKIAEAIFSSTKGNGDPEDDASFGWLLLDTLFFVGVLPKFIIGLFGTREPKESFGDVVARGRVRDQVEFYDRAVNQFNVSVLGKRPMPWERTLVDLSYIADRFLTGIKWFGGNDPDHPGKAYIWHGYKLNLWPPLKYTTETKHTFDKGRPVHYGERIKPLGDVSGHGGLGRFYYLVKPESWTPFLDFITNK